MMFGAFIGKPRGSWLNVKLVLNLCDHTYELTILIPVVKSWTSVSVSDVFNTLVGHTRTNYDVWGFYREAKGQLAKNK